MGKRIIQQRRGRGSPTYAVRKRAYRFKIAYPPLDVEGQATVLDIINSPGHTAPLVKLSINGKTYYNPAVLGIAKDDVIEIGSNAEVRPGCILPLANIPVGVEICNIELRPGDGGKLVRASGTSAKIVKKLDDKVIVLMPSKKEKVFDARARATVGIVAGFGRKEKPWVKAGKKWHAMHARGKLYPRTSAVKMNAVDHPFGSGRGKNIKSKIAKRNAPPGKKVGLIRPRRTGKKK